MRRKTGQIFPFCLLLLTILLAFIISNFEIGFLNLRKIQQQKKLDGIAMSYATDYARGLNALAGLNEGLEIAIERGHMMAIAFTTLGACAPFAPPCARAFTKLAIKIRPFYKKLNKLGKELAEQQNQIIGWMTKTRCQANQASFFEFKNFHMYPSFPCTVQPDFRHLPFYRPDQDSDEKIKGVSKCEILTFNSYNQFKSRIDSLASQRFTNSIPNIEVRYLSNSKKTHFEKPLTFEKAQELTPSMSVVVRNNHEQFQFSQATLEQCTEFKRLFGSLTEGIPFVFDIPAPLVFKEDFFQEKNRIIFIASNKINSDFENVHPGQFEDLAKKVWALTEIKINGTDFKKMEFKPKIESISLHLKLTDELQRKKPLQGFPNLRSIQHEIAH